MKNHIPVGTANGTEPFTTDLNPGLPCIIHRKNKVYSWQLCVSWFPVQLQS
jgi:hypothetical protein